MWYRDCNGKSIAALGGCLALRAAARFFFGATDRTTGKQTQTNKQYRTGTTGTYGTGTVPYRRYGTRTVYTQVKKPVIFGSSV